MILQCIREALRAPSDTEKGYEDMSTTTACGISARDGGEDVT